MIATTGRAAVEPGTVIVHGSAAGFAQEIAAGVRIGSDVLRAFSFLNRVAKPIPWLFLQDGGDVERDPDLVAD